MIFMAGTFGNKKWFSRKSIEGVVKEKVFRRAISDDSIWHSHFVGQSKDFRGRTFERLFVTRSFDLKKHISGILASKKGRLRILDAGAGYLFLSADIKKVFKRRVHVTGLSLASTVVSEKVEKEIRTSLSKIYSSGVREGPEVEFLRERLGYLMQVKKNSKSVNSYRVSFFENYSPKEKYGLILDIYGPATYSKFPKRVVEQYANLLETNGRVYTTGDFGNIIEAEFGRKSVYAKQTGTYLSFMPINRAGEINQITKHRL